MTAETTVVPRFDGRALIDGRRVAVIAYDFTVLAGSMGVPILLLKTSPVSCQEGPA